MVVDYNRTEYVSLDHVCEWMSYCTHHSGVDVPQYVHVDVPSAYLCQWMFYYTHHSSMDAPQYVYVDVSSELLS